MFAWAHEEANMDCLMQIKVSGSPCAGSSFALQQQLYLQLALKKKLILILTNF
jgi:hypothetical protein